MQTWHPAVSDTLSVLTGASLTVNGYDGWEKESLKTAKDPTAVWNITEPRILKCYGPGQMTAQNEPDMQFSGRLIGGCMDCLVNLLGTKYDKVKAFNERYTKDGLIWFLESCDLNVMSIRRAMWQMENAGWFEHVKGFIIGRPLVFGQEMMGLDQYEAVMGIIRKYQVPVVMDADLGHLPPAMPIICGSIGNVQVKGNQMTLSMELR